LLDIPRVDLEQFVREQRVRFREDASNASLDHQRNLIRHELLPLLRAKFQPALDKVVLRAMDIVGADAEVVIAAAQTALKGEARRWDNLPIGVQRRTLYEQLQAQGVGADFDLVEALRLKPDGPVSIGARRSATRDQAGQVRIIETGKPTFSSNSKTLHLSSKSSLAKFQGVQFKWQLGSRPKTIGAEPGCERFDARKVGPTVTLRHWRAGDRFQPIGMPKPVKLQDWFTNRKVPQAERHRLIVAVAADGRIFWVEGQRIDERFKLTAATGKCLIWRWQRR
jgi:tRNA(Ile)-lysidine synthase